MGKPARVSVHGMYDCHLFHKVIGSTVDEVIAAWLQHISGPIPVEFEDGRIKDLGPSALCPAAVLDEDGKKIRQVGKMVFADNRIPDAGALNAYREALLADPDVPRLLGLRSNK